MQRNDLLTMTAESLGAEMEGVCHHEGMVVFVPGLLPEEEALVRILKAEKRFAYGKVEKMMSEPSGRRRAVDCASFPQCGGCTARHLEYSATLEAKRQHVQDCFERIGHLQVEVPPVIGMESPFFYRNKTAMPVGGTREEPVLGFFAPRSHRIIPADQCPNAMVPSGDIARAVMFWMKEYHVSAYDEVSGTGLLRHLVIRVNRAREAMVTLVATRNSIPHVQELIHVLSGLGAVSIYLNVNSKRTNVIFGDQFQLLYGKTTLSDTLCDLRFELSPDSFFQINPFQTETLYRTALEFAELSPEDTLCDVYCGAGTISLMMAQHCRQVTGIEIVPAAIRNARENAVRNHVENVVFHEGSAEELLPRMVRENLRPDVIVVDPPRKGLDPAVIEAIAQARPDRLVYVSCNPATQARDAALLREQGYQVRRIQPVDMFPFTSHIETVCLFSQDEKFVLP